MADEGESATQHAAAVRPAVLAGDGVPAGRDNVSGAATTPNEAEE